MILARHVNDVLLLLFVYLFFYVVVYKIVDLRKLCITHSPITNQCEELALIQVIKALVGNQANLEYNTFSRN